MRSIKLVSINATNLIDQIIKYTDDGYQLTRLGYIRKWWLLTEYYAVVAKPQPFVEFKIGPIRNKQSASLHGE